MSFILFMDSGISSLGMVARVLLRSESLACSIRHRISHRTLRTINGIAEAGWTKKILVQLGVQRVFLRGFGEPSVSRSFN